MQLKKAVEDAKKNRIYSTYRWNYNSSRNYWNLRGQDKFSFVQLQKVPGVIAGGPVRAVLELAGVNDILSKCLGSRTPINMVRATITALKELKTIEEIARLRGKKPEEIRG